MTISSNSEKKPFTIREFVPEDLDSVIWINRVTLPENYPSFFFKMHHERFPKAFLVATIDKKIVGYIMCRVEQGKMHVDNRNGISGHIISLAVISEARRKGIGKALMTKAMENLYKYYGVEEYYLEVRVTNIPAISLYKKLGFRITNIIKGYYLDGEDAYVMARKAPYVETGVN